MIIKHLVESIRKQNWFSVCIELLIVIFGVYFGILLGNIQQQNQLESETLIGLQAFESELRSDLERVDEIIKIQTHRIGLYKETIAQLSQPEISSKSLVAKFDEFFAYNDTFFPNKAAYNSMRDAGYLSALPEQDLKLQISKMFERIYVRQSMNADIYDDLLFSFGGDIMTIHWDGNKQKMLENNSAVIMANNIKVLKGQASFYTSFLQKTVKPAMIKTLDMIDAYQDKAQPN